MPYPGHLCIFFNTFLQLLILVGIVCAGMPFWLLYIWIFTFGPPLVLLVIRLHHNNFTPPNIQSPALRGSSSLYSKCWVIYLDILVEWVYDSPEFLFGLVLLFPFNMLFFFGHLMGMPSWLRWLLIIIFVPPVHLLVRRLQNYGIPPLIRGRAVYGYSGFWTLYFHVLGEWILESLRFLYWLLGTVGLHCVALVNTAMLRILHLIIWLADLLLQLAWRDSQWFFGVAPDDYVDYDDD
jgi:hypothetical protein